MASRVCNPLNAAVLLRSAESPRFLGRPDAVAVPSPSRAVVTCVPCVVAVAATEERSSRTAGRSKRHVAAAASVLEAPTVDESELRSELLAQLSSMEAEMRADRMMENSRLARLLLADFDVATMRGLPLTDLASSSNKDPQSPRVNSSARSNVGASTLLTPVPATIAKTVSLPNRLDARSRRRLARAQAMVSTEAVKQNKTSTGAFKGKAKCDRTKTIVSLVQSPSAEQLSSVEAERHADRMMENSRLARLLLADLDVATMRGLPLADLASSFNKDPHSPRISSSARSNVGASTLLTPVPATIAKPMSLPNRLDARSRRRLARAQAMVSTEAVKPRKTSTGASKGKGKTDRSKTVVPPVKSPSAEHTHLRYLADMGKAPLLSGEEEIELSRSIQDLLRLQRVKAKLEQQKGKTPSEAAWAFAAGCHGVEELRQRVRDGNAARHRMLVSNLRLVASIAKRYQFQGLTFQDLCQEGVLGLLKGAERFDYSKGYRFSTYAFWWIRQTIMRAIANDGRMIRLPMRTVEALYKIRRASKEQYSELNREPTTKELAASCGLSVEKVEVILSGALPVVSIDSPTQFERADNIADHRVGPSEAVETTMMREDVRSVLKTLRPREREILRMRYGLDTGGKIATLDEVGKCFAVTRERIRQIEAEALRKLRDNGLGEALRDYL